MGEKIRDLGEIRIGKSMYLVELNKGTGKNKTYDIHVQNNEVRLNISQEDFLKLATAILYANDAIKYYKDGK